MRIAVLGAGAWGTALAASLAQRHDTLLWARDAAQLAVLARDRRNERYLPGIDLPSALRCTADFGRATAHARSAADAGLIVIATPMSALRAMLSRCAADGVGVWWLCKGVEAGTGRFGHEIAAEVADEIATDGVRESTARATDSATESATDSATPSAIESAGNPSLAIRVGVLSGPSFALEVARGQPTALVAASHDAELREQAIAAFHGDALRVYTSADPVGVEVGGAVKNVIAIATGIVEGLSLGLNARAALVTRGLAEMTRLGQALGARSETFMGLSGLGDLVLTATGDLSRNRQVGLQLARGRPLAEVLAGLGHVAEGVYSAPTVLARADAVGAEMPITAAVCAVLDGRLSPRDAVQRLMQREARAEHTEHTERAVHGDEHAEHSPRGNTP